MAPFYIFDTSLAEAVCLVVLVLSEYTLPSPICEWLGAAKDVTADCAVVMWTLRRITPNLQEQKKLNTAIGLISACRLLPSLIPYFQSGGWGRDETFVCGFNEYAWMGSITTHRPY